MKSHNLGNFFFPLELLLFFLILKITRTFKLVNSQPAEGLSVVYASRLFNTTTKKQQQNTDTLRTQDFEDGGKKEVHMKNVKDDNRKIIGLTKVYSCHFL